MGLIMRMIVLLALLMCFPFLLPRAQAGTCPPGFYPVNSPGVMGCAPIPGNADQSEATGPSWMTTWGAIAADGERSVVASTFGQHSKRKAESIAIKECRAKGGGKKCKTWISFYNQCAAMAAGDSKAITYRAETSDLARQEALKSCSALTANCAIIQTVCSHPVLVQ